MGKDMRKYEVAPQCIYQNIQLS